MNPLPIPYGDRLVVTDGMVSEPWERWLTTQAQALSQAPNRLVPLVPLTDKNASIGTTNFTPGFVPAGVYWLTYYTRITTVAAVNSSLTVTLGWTDHGTAQTFSGAAIVGNTINDWQSDTKLVYVDSLTPVTYSTTYASNAAGEMKYQLYVALLSVGI